MARSRSEDVETIEPTTEGEVEETSGPEASAEDTQPKAKKEPARGQLPEGYVTPIGLAKILTERGLHTNREGNVVEVRPQMVYSYIKNAPKDDTFPMEQVTDSIGKVRDAVVAEAGVAWWERKNARVATRKQNAADKLAKQEARKAEKAAAAAAVEAEGASEGEGESTVEAE